MNYAHVLRRSSRADPGGTALVQGDRRVDYLALEMAARRVATILGHRHGIVPGDRVAVLLPDTPELAFAVYGVLWAGAVLYALDPQTEPDALAEALGAAEVELIIGWHAAAEDVEELGGALDVDWLLVEPREFSRLLAAVPPRATIADVAGDGPAILLEPAPLLELGHAELAERASQAARERGLGRGVLVAAPASLYDPANQVGTLHAAVAAGAAVGLAAAAAPVF